MPFEELFYGFLICMSVIRFCTKRTLLRGLTVAAAVTAFVAAMTTSAPVWLCLLAGIGINQFYARHWVKGLLYLAFSWTGIPIAMGLVDWMIAVPKQPDENGMIMI